MPASKRRRPPSDDGEENITSTSNVAQSAPPLSFHHYLLLPAELRRIIIRFACHTPSSASSPAARPSLLGFDTGTTASLSLVCREMHNQVAPFLWSNLTITRPSSLYALNQALAANPERAKLIITLHIGPQDILPADWWPLRKGPAEEFDSYGSLSFGVPERWIASSLPQSQLPAECQDGQLWPLDCSASGCRQKAVDDALEVIQASLQVNLLEEVDESTQSIQSIMEAQAALDLFLMHIRSLEQGDPNLIKLSRRGAPVRLPCRTSKCNHFPALVVAQNSSTTTTPSSPSNALIFSRSQILRHLARPGSTTDRFDHPLILTRSGFTAEVTTPARERATRYKLRTEDSWHIGEFHEGYEWPDLKLLQDEDKVTGTTHNVALINTGTLGAILRLSRDVLRLTSNIKTLSLTGFLERALDGNQKLPKLRRLSLGPRLPRWYASLSLGGLEQIEELRICAAPLNPRDIRKITKNMRKIKSLEWEMVEPFSRRMRLSITETIDSLTKNNIPTKQTAAWPPQRKSSRSTTTQDELSSPARTHNPTPLIIAKLHPVDVFSILATAPDAETRSAWLEGTPTAGNARQLRLEEHEHATDGPLRPSKDNTNRVWLDLFEEGRRWRERG